MYNQPRALDSILKYLIDKDEEYVVHSAKDIANAVLPELEPEVVYQLLNKLIDYHELIVTASVMSRDIYSYKVNFEANSLTRNFLAEGGFVKQQDKQTELQIQQEKTKEEERQLRLETINLNKWNKIFLLINTLIAVIALSISIYTAFYSQKPIKQTIPII